MTDTPQIKRIAAIHDLCGYGKCSLGTALPVLSAAGFEVVPIPTGIFSTQTAIDGWEHLDTTAFLPKYVGSLAQNHIKFDAIYSGFLSSPEQVDIILKFYTEDLDALRILDPVMGDKGKIYDTYTPELCQAMKQLVSGADILTPNLTEAYCLTDMEYDPAPTDSKIQQVLQTLQKMGAKNIVLKGARIKDGQILNYVVDKDNNQEIAFNPFVDQQIHGTGDLYCSTLTAAYMNGYSLIEAAKFSGDFVYRCVRYTLTQKGYEKRGVSFEPLMYNLSGLVKEI